MTNVVQMPLEGIGEYALIQVGKKMRKVPIWLWFQLKVPGGIYSIIREWQGGILMQSPAPAVEAEALRNIDRQAKAYRRFWADPNHRSYYRNLSRLERAVLKLERKALSENPHLGTAGRCEWIAERLNKSLARRHVDHVARYGGYTAEQVRGMLEDATEVISFLYEERLAKEMDNTIQALNQLQTEDFDTIAA